MENKPTTYLVRELSPSATLADAIALHWPEYLFEGLELGAFMLAACAFGTLLFYSQSACRVIGAIRCGSSGSHGRCDGRHRDSDHSFSDGASIRSTFQPCRFLHVLLSWEDAPGGRVPLYSLPGCWRSVWGTCCEDSSSALLHYLSVSTLCRSRSRTLRCPPRIPGRVLPMGLVHDDGGAPERQPPTPFTLYLVAGWTLGSDVCDCILTGVWF